MVRDALENACHVTVVLNKVDLVNPKYKVRHDPLFHSPPERKRRGV